ncbi:VOC family protein [Streptomyces sp. NPDC001691]|uniref:VOC family protein n=1 Tax=unclassified Streptomyces TaxID=2593676 RepID=UPI000DEABA97|nr:VOC family protein [Streptomyces sp. SDr-06]RCH67436.1 VOC family protein [Streptomyces sp. SDr-06]
MPATVEGPDFIALQVKDVPAAAAFFEERLGLRRAPASPPGAVVFATSPIAFAVREPLPGVDLDGAARPGLGVALWLRTSDASALREQLLKSDTRDVGPLQDSPFGPMFSFSGPEGYRLTVHGG